MRRVARIGGLGLLAVLAIVLIVAVTLTWFFGAEKTMLRQMQPVLDEPHKYMGKVLGGTHHHERALIHTDWFLNTRFKLKRPRNITHYPADFIENVFKRHHFSAVLSIILAFLFLAIIGMLQDKAIFVIPAAAAILLLFSILIAGAGAMVYWLGSWSFPAFMVILLAFELLFRFELIDPRLREIVERLVAVGLRPVGAPKVAGGLGDEGLGLVA